MHHTFFVLFVAAFALVWARLWMSATWLPRGHWIEGVLVLLATASTLASCSRQLPAQNVLLAAVIILLTAGGIVSLGALTAVPFGPFSYNPDAIGQMFFHCLPWPVPFIWLVLLLNSCGVARLILRSWRQRRDYGLWLIGLTALLTVMLELGLECFATMVQGYWSWKPTRLPWDWYTAPWANFLAWAVTAVLILAFVTPALIRKKPGRPPPDYHPLVVWLLLNVLFFTGAAVHRLTTAMMVIGAQGVTVALLAGLGALRSSSSTNS